MTNQDKPSVEGLMRLVSKYGEHRSAADANRNQRNYAALDDAFARIEEYAERIASQSAAAPPIAPVAWMVFTDGEYDYKVFANQHEAEAEAAETDREPIPLYAAPPSAVLLEVMEALTSAKANHGVALLSDPPQDAWKSRGVDAKLTAAIAKLREWMGERG